MVKNDTEKTRPTRGSIMGPLINLFIGFKQKVLDTDITIPAHYLAPKWLPGPEA